MSISRQTAWFGLTLILASSLPDAVAAEPPARLSPIQVIDLGTKELPDKVPVISNIALGPAGTRMATCGDDHLVRIWNAEEGLVLRLLTGHGDWVRSVAFSADGRLVATAGDDRRVRLWRIDEDKPFASIATADQVVHTLAFSPDGRLVAAAGFGKTIHLIDTTAGREQGVLDAPGTDVSAMAFSPDGSPTCRRRTPGHHPRLDRRRRQAPVGPDRPPPARSRAGLLAGRWATRLGRRRTRRPALGRRHRQRR